MQMRRGVYCLLILLAGCTSVPKPSPYPYSAQEHMQAAHHWQVLASEVAERVTTRVRGGPTTSTEYVYIPSDDRSAFGKAFHGFLTTELMNRGIPVSSNPNSPLRIDWAV
jgi:hypothetical protein